MVWLLEFERLTVKTKRVVPLLPSFWRTSLIARVGSWTTLRIVVRTWRKGAVECGRAVGIAKRTSRPRLGPGRRGRCGKANGDCPAGIDAVCATARASSLDRAGDKCGCVPTARGGTRVRRHHAERARSAGAR